VKDKFFVAFNSGDAASVIALFAPDAEFTNNFGPIERRDFEELLAWNVAQGTRYTPSDCAADVGGAADVVSVSCPFITHNAVSQASGGPPVPFLMTVDVTAAGIVAHTDRFGDPDFNVVHRPFERWMNEHHPEDTEAVSFGTWNSIAEAEQNGTLVALYGAEWGEYLETNGCAFNETC